MKRSLFWLQAGGCGGDTMSLLSAESPDVLAALDALDVEVLWHPSLSQRKPKEQSRVIDSILARDQPLDFFCLEGAVVRGPGGTGMYDTVGRRPKKELISDLARRARYVIAVGTCASFGGVGADGEIEACGLQYLKAEKGGFLGAAFKSEGGLPVINLPGCPCHSEVIGGVLMALANGAPLAMTDLNSPADYYGMLVHQGCMRNEYHEYRVEDSEFGNRGCLFFHLGCRGPLTHGPCNKLLWGRHSSKTRIGVPCVGCTRPEFPQPQPFFETANIAGIPLDLPEGVDRAHYLAYKGMAAAAAPERLRTRKTGL